MQVECFKRNLSGTNGGQDFDPEMLEQMFHSIRLGYYFSLCCVEFLFFKCQCCFHIKVRKYHKFCKNLFDMF